MRAVEVVGIAGGAWVLIVLGTLAALRGAARARRAAEAEIASRGAHPSNPGRIRPSERLTPTDRALLAAFRDVPTADGGGGTAAG